MGALKYYTEGPLSPVHVHIIVSRSSVKHLEALVYMHVCTPWLLANLHTYIETIPEALLILRLHISTTNMCEQKCFVQTCHIMSGCQMLSQLLLMWACTLFYCIMGTIGTTSVERNNQIFGLFVQNGDIQIEYYFLFFF